MENTFTILLSIFSLLLFPAFVVTFIRWKSLKTDLLRKEEETRRENEKHTKTLAELESLRQTMDQRKAEQSEIIHRVVHDLRTPLNNIIGFADILLSGMEGELTEPQRKDVEIILNSARSLTGQVNDLQEMDASESGILQLHRTPLSPAHALREAVEELRKEIEEKGCTVRIKVPDNLPALHADAQRLQQILTHLLGDTLRFLQGGEILFQAESSNRNDPPSASPHKEKDFLRITMTVHNTDTEEKHLDAFYRMHLPTGTARHSSPGGSSLGVRIARKLIHLLGGTIGLECKGDRVRGLWLALPTVKNPR